MKKQFCFTVDDNIRVLRELSEGDFASLFDHPYLAMYLRLHEKYTLRVQLNLFYEDKDTGFCLADVTDRYRDEWEKNADWLRLSFHSRIENVKPYEFSDYAELNEDCAATHREILRFAGEKTLARSTTIHYCRTTADGVRALYDNGVRGLLGLYGTEESPRLSYQSTEDEGRAIRQGEIVISSGMAYGSIDVILNERTMEEILPSLQPLCGRDTIKVMIHEQYFYPARSWRYQPDFEQKLDAAFSYLCENGYVSAFFEDWFS